MTAMSSQLEPEKLPKDQLCRFTMDWSSAKAMRKFVAAEQMYPTMTPATMSMAMELMRRAMRSTKPMVISEPRNVRFYWLMPLVPLANYFLFFGRDFLNLFPDSWRRPHRNYRTTAGPRPNANWANSYRSKSGEKCRSGGPCRPASALRS